MLLLNAQAGLFYDITPNHQVRFTFARTNRFPTMFQRYSTRMGRQIPNPYLGPETANHFELGYRGMIAGRLNLNAAGYYSQVMGKIVTVQVPNPKSPYWTVDFSRNLDMTSLYGLELNGELNLNEYLSAGVNFTLAAYTINHSEEQVKSLPYYPATSGNLYVDFRPIPTVSLLPRLEYLGERDIDAEGTRSMDAYWLVHFKVTADFTRHLSLSAGVENLFDTYYEIRQHSPLAGRTYNVSCMVKY
jgi:iron complex outermembrane receptor protein